MGKTHAAVNEIIVKALLKPGNYLFAAPERTQAKGIVWDLMKELLPREVVQSINESELLIRLSNGSKIIVNGTNKIGNSLRGFGFDGIVLDEFRDMDPKIYEEVLRPTISATNGWVLFTSTPNGRGNHVHNFYLRGTSEDWPDWSSHLFKASETGIIPQKELEALRRGERVSDEEGSLSATTFSQEYECEFIESSGSAFRGIENCISGTLEDPQPGWSYVLGVDLAKYEDFTVITVVDKHRHHMVHFERFNNLEWSYQKARIEAIARRYNQAQITIDATGVGDPIEEDLKHLGLSVNGVKYTQQTKRQMMENLIIRIEQRKITFPDVKELLEELRAFTYTLSKKTRSIWYTAPQGLHDDAVNSLALAVYEIGERIPVPPPQQPVAGWGFDGASMDTYHQPSSSITGY